MDKFKKQNSILVVFFTATENDKMAATAPSSPSHLYKSCDVGRGS